MTKTLQIKNDLKKGVQQSLNLSIEERMAFIANLIIDKIEVESSNDTTSINNSKVVEDVSK